MITGEGRAERRRTMLPFGQTSRTCTADERGDKMTFVTGLTLLDRRIYVMTDVDLFLGLASGTARRWIDGYQRAGRTYPPVIRPERTDDESVSWGEFVETRLLANYRAKGLSLQRLRPAVQQLRVEFRSPIRWPLPSHSWMFRVASWSARSRRTPGSTRRCASWLSARASLCSPRRRRTSLTMQCLPLTVPLRRCGLMSTRRMFASIRCDRPGSRLCARSRQRSWSKPSADESVLGLGKLLERERHDVVYPGVSMQRSRTTAPGRAPTTSPSA